MRDQISKKSLENRRENFCGKNETLFLTKKECDSPNQKLSLLFFFFSFSLFAFFQRKVLFVGKPLYYFFFSYFWIEKRGMEFEEFIDHAGEKRAEKNRWKTTEEMKGEGEEKKGDENHFNMLFVKRLGVLLSVVFGGKEKGPKLICFFLIAFSLFNIWVTSLTGHVISNFYGAIDSLDTSAFWSNLWFASIIVAASATLQSILESLQECLAWFCRKGVSFFIHYTYFTDLRFYRVLNVVDNPDQRITQDVDLWSTTYAKVFANLITTPITIIYYTYLTWEGVGWYAPFTIYLFFFLGYGISKMIMSPITSLVFIQERLEGNFRFAHIRIRSSAESIAIYRGQEREKDTTDDKLNSLLRNRYFLVLWHFVLNMSANLFTYSSTIVNYTLVAIAVLFFPSEAFQEEYFSSPSPAPSPTPVSFSSAASISSYVALSSFNLIMLAYGFSSLTNLFKPLSDLAGYTHRIAELLSALENFHHEKEGMIESESQKGQIGDSRKEGREEAQNEEFFGEKTPILSVNQFQTKRSPGFEIFEKEAIEFSDVSFDPIFHHVSFRVERGQNLVIMGPPGCGKSAILRVLNGVWRHSSGSITKPPGIFYVPQTSYLPLVDLSRQISYPSPEPPSFQEVVELLEIVGLSYLLKRPFIPITSEPSSSFSPLPSSTSLFNSHSEEETLLPRSEKSPHAEGEEDLSSPLSLSLSLPERISERREEEPSLIHWTEKLSPGEKQLLSMARVFYHQPHFAVLDEATSSLSEPIEKKLYRLMKEKGITTITVAHREALCQWHQFILSCEKIQKEEKEGELLDVKNVWKFSSLEKEKEKRKG